MVRVVVVEDHDVVRRGLIQALQRGQELSVVGEAASLAEAETLTGFDVALVDLGLPDGRGEEVIRGFRRRVPGARCVVLTMLDDDGSLFGALQAGAQGYLLKESSPRALRDAIHEAHRGGVPLTPRMARFLVERVVPMPQGTDEPLTPREHEVLHSLAHGLTYAEVADSLAIAIGTVQSHVKSLYRKLEVSSKTEAAAEAVRRGLVEL